LDCILEISMVENSRFAAFYSRLCRREFPFRLSREFADNGLICLTFSARRRLLIREKSKNSRFIRKNRELARAGYEPAAFSDLSGASRVAWSALGFGKVLVRSPMRRNRATPKGSEHAE
jgi:hypothetical protein